MNNTVEENIFNALKELTGSQFKEFTFRLKLINYEGKPNIPKASLENAGREKVVDLLVQHYGEDAREVCIGVLRKCNRNDLVKNLEEIGQKGMNDTTKNPKTTLKDNEQSFDFEFWVQCRFRFIWGCLATLLDI